MNKQVMIIGGVIFVIALTFLYPQKDMDSKKNNEQIIEMADNNEQSNFSFQNTQEGGTLITTASGLQYEVIKMGNGEKPNATDKVEVHYHGTLEDGTVFDSSVDRGQTISFPLNRVIKGWTEGVQLMPVGSKFKFIIPPELGYGDRGAGAVIPPNATLIFDIEIVDIQLPGYKIIKTNEIDKYQNGNYIFIDIRTKKERETTGIIEGSLEMTAFDINGNFEPSFMKIFQSTVDLDDNIVFISNEGEISSILANGFVEQIGATNMHSLEGGIQKLIKENFKLIKN